VEPSGCRRMRRRMRRGPWHSRCGGGGVAGGKFCGGLNLVSGRLRREGWEKTNHDFHRGSFC
jgi:hypothetical protein